MMRIWIFLLWGTTLSYEKNVCAPLIRQYEVLHGIPTHLLSAISLVESGRKIGGAVIAWPWTINANGKVYIFATKKEAVAKVHKLYQVGITSIDVGCMQVNLKHHPHAFPTLDAAFEPVTNIAYAAQFLIAKKKEKGCWMRAVAHYHSSTPQFHVPYMERVLKAWHGVQKSHIENHHGEFLKNIKAPSGRKLPMIVRFASYKGIHDKVSKPSPPIRHRRSEEYPKIIHQSLLANQNLKPKIIIIPRASVKSR